MNTLRYLWERKVSTIMLILNIIFIVIVFTTKDIKASYFFLLDIPFIFRGIMWEGQKDDTIKDLQNQINGTK